MHLRFGSGSSLLASLFVLSMAGSQVRAQTTQEPRSNKETAPYSRYGIGELRNGSSPLLRSMGTISSAYSSATALNPDNPASYASLRLTTYDGGLEASMRTIRTGTDAVRTGTVSMSYLAVGIPLGKYAGMAFGLRPQSRVFYNLADSSITPGLGKTVSSYLGDGGLNYAYIGIAGKVKGFSAGVNVGYSFGAIENTSQLLIADTAVALSPQFVRNTRIGGLYWKGGLQYEAPLNKKLNLRIGGTVTLQQSLRARRDDYGIAVRQLALGGETRDSAFSIADVKGTVTLPLSISGGVMVMSGKYGVGLDVQHTSWSDFRNFDQPDSVASATRFAMGGEFTPSTTLTAKYLSRITYRLGVVYGSDYVKLRNTELNYYGITFGASLPFKRSPDRVHMAFELGSRGTTANGLIQENYFRFALGISLNDRWFIKRRYE